MLSNCDFINFATVSPVKQGILRLTLKLVYGFYEMI